MLLKGIAELLVRYKLLIERGVYMKEFIKKLLKSCAIGRLVYEPMHKLYQLYSIPHRKRMLRKYGREVLAHLAEILEKHKIPAFFFISEYHPKQSCVRE